MQTIFAILAPVLLVLAGDCNSSQATVPQKPANPAKALNVAAARALSNLSSLAESTLAGICLRAEWLGIDTDRVAEVLGLANPAKELTRNDADSNAQTPLTAPAIAVAWRSNLAFIPDPLHEGQRTACL